MHMDDKNDHVVYTLKASVAIISHVDGGLWYADPNQVNDAHHSETVKKFGRMLEYKSDSFNRDWHKVLFAIQEAESRKELHTERLWHMSSAGQWLPPMDHDVIKVIAAWFLDNAKRQDLHNVKSCVNTHYKLAGSVRPWVDYSRTMQKYEALRMELSVEEAIVDEANGKIGKLKRVPIPEESIETRLQIGEKAEGRLLAKTATTFVGIISGLRCIRQGVARLRARTT